MSVSSKSFKFVTSSTKEIVENLFNLQLKGNSITSVLKIAHNVE